MMNFLAFGAKNLVQKGLELASRRPRPPAEWRLLVETWEEADPQQHRRPNECHLRRLGGEYLSL
jgi:hypothetical protein